MPNYSLIRSAICGVVCASLFSSASAAEVERDAARNSFRQDVVPLLRERCFRCHEGRDAKSGVRLDLRDELFGTRGDKPLVLAGRSAASRLIEVVSGADPQTSMPPEGPRLSKQQIDMLRRWIDAGAPWDAAVLPTRDDAEQHWAFQPIARPPLTDVRDAAWSRTAVDRFIAARHESQGLSPAASAERRVLLRRVYWDLLGLPPTIAEADAFAVDDRPDAWQRVVDRLLASPHYGERWGRHWLDVARWAESEGFESNHPRPFAWRYRDYVVRAFNADKPFATFVREQLAGDELPDYSDEHLIATGFLAAARISSNEEDKWLQRNDVTVDVVNAVGSAFLGLTLHCAQCHDHKFDPISIRDYYQLHAFFTRGLPLNVRLRDAQPLPPDEHALATELAAAVALKQALLEKSKRRLRAQQLQKLTASERTAVETPTHLRSAEQELVARRASLKFEKTMGEIERNVADEDRKLYDEVKKRVAELDKKTRPLPQTFAFFSPVTSPHRLEVLPSVGFYPLPYEPDELAKATTYIMPRGEVHQIGATVTPHVPAVLNRTCRFPSGDARDGSLPNRMALAAWLTDPQQPLVDRVYVNRLWQFHFGRGLSATPDDFGVRGDPPSHPELLDWLATELRASGGSTKHLHRELLTSATYQQAATATAAMLARDPDNRYWSRWSVRRLDVESLHDGCLATSDRLDRSCGGPSVPQDRRESSRRRNLYLMQRRGQPTDWQRLFDGPNECAASVGVRHVSTTALQSLYLLNSEFVVQCARDLAASIVAETSADRDQQIESAFRRVLLRSPTSAERQAATRLWLAAQTAAPLELLCQSLLNLNELVYVE